MSHIEPYVSRFPWHSDARKSLTEFNLEESLSDDVTRELARKRIISAINTGTIPDPYVDDTVEATPAQILISYPAARILVSLIDDSRIVNKYARAEAKSAAKRLKTELNQYKTSGGGLSTAYDVPQTQTKTEITIEEAFEDFDISLTWHSAAKQFSRSYTKKWLTTHADSLDVQSVIQERIPVPPGYTQTQMHGPENQSVTATFNAAYRTQQTQDKTPGLEITDFVDIASHLDSEEWGLYKQDVVDGTVFFSSVGQLRTLCEELIYQQVSENLPIDVHGMLTEPVLELFESDVEPTKEAFEGDVFSYEIDRVDLRAMPPLINNLIDRVHANENIDHDGRFALGSFLVHIGMSDDEILDLLKINNNFGRDATLYQLNSIRKKDSGEGYVPPSYETLEARGMNWDKDELEKKVKHPLVYYRIKLQELDEKDAEEAEKDGDDDDDEGDEQEPSKSES